MAIHKSDLFGADDEALFRASFDGNMLSVSASCKSALRLITLQADTLITGLLMQPLMACEESLDAPRGQHQGLLKQHLDMTWKRIPHSPRLTLDTGDWAASLVIGWARPPGTRYGK